MVIAVLLAIVEIKLPPVRICPTISGKVYTSVGCSVLVCVIRFVIPAVPPEVTRFTLIVYAVAPVLTAVNLSIIVVPATAVYCVVCAVSADLDGIKTVAVTVIIYPT